MLVFVVSTHTLVLGHRVQAEFLISKRQDYPTMYRLPDLNRIILASFYA